MKSLSLLAIVAFLFATAGAFSAEPKVNRNTSKPRPGKATEQLPDQDNGESKAGRQQKILHEFDANGNGKLEPDEQAAARKAAAERRKQRKQKSADAGANTLQQPDGLQPLNGQPLPAAGGGQRGSGRAKLMERFDLNHDGILSPQEEARAKTMMQRKGTSGAFGGALPPQMGPRKARGGFKQ